MATTSPSDDYEDKFVVYLEKEADGLLTATVYDRCGDRQESSKGWRTYGAALEWAGRVCADLDGDHSQETIDRTGG